MVKAMSLIDRSTSICFWRRINVDTLPSAFPASLCCKRSGKRDDPKRMLGLHCSIIVGKRKPAPNFADRSGFVFREIAVLPLVDFINPLDIAVLALKKKYITYDNVCQGGNWEEIGRKLYRPFPIYLLGISWRGCSGVLRGVLGCSGVVRICIGVYTCGRRCA